MSTPPARIVTFAPRMQPPSSRRWIGVLIPSFRATSTGYRGRTARFAARSEPAACAARIASVHLRRAASECENCALRLELAPRHTYDEHAYHCEVFPLTSGLDPDR